MNHDWLQMNNPSGISLQKHEVFELPPSPPVTPHGSVTLVPPTSTHPQQYHGAGCDSTEPNQNFVIFLPHSVSTYQSQQTSAYSGPSNNMMHQYQYFPACRQQTSSTSYQYQKNANITYNQQNQTWGTSRSQNQHLNYWQNNYQASTFSHQNAFQNSQLSNFQTATTTQQHQDPPSLQGPFLPEPLQQQSMGNTFHNQAYTQPRNTQTHNEFQRRYTAEQSGQHFQPTNSGIRNHINQPPHPRLRQNFPQLRQERFNPIKRLNYLKPPTQDMIISPPQSITYESYAKEMQHSSHSVDPNKKPLQTGCPTKNLSLFKKSETANQERYVYQHSMSMSEVGQGAYYNPNYQNQNGNFDYPNNGHFSMLNSCRLLPKYPEKAATQITKNGESIGEKHAIATAAEIQKTEDILIDDNFLIEIIEGAVNPDGSEAQVEDIPFDLKCQFESLS